MSTIKVNRIENTSTTDGGVSIDVDGHVTIDGQQLPTAGALSNRNLIINGAMQVAQRGTSVSAKSGGGYHTVDRCNLFQNLGAMNLSQSTDSPDGFSYSLKHEVSTSATPSSTSIVTYAHAVEGYNVAHLNWGTSSAKAVTVSFWVKSSVTGTYGAWMRNANANRYQPKEFSVSSANTWEQKTLTFTGDTSGTWGTTNGIGINFGIVLAAGSSQQGTADTWQTGPAYTTSNQVNWQGTSGATFYLTGVQLEVGSKATPFEHESYGQTLAKCQRYYYTHVVGSSMADVGVGAYYNISLFAFTVRYPVTMRTPPDLEVTTGADYYRIFANGTADTLNAMASAGRATVNTMGIDTSTGTSGTIGHGGLISTNNTSAYMAFDAEL